MTLNLQTSGCPPNSYLRRTSTITKPSTYKKGTQGHLCHSVCISSCVWCFLDTVTIGDLKVQGYTFAGVEKTLGLGYPGKFNGILRLGCNTHALVKPGQLPEPVFEFLGNQVASSSQVSWSLELLTPSTTLHRKLLLP